MLALMCPFPSRPGLYLALVLPWALGLAAQPAPLTEAQALSRALARPEWQAITQLPAKQSRGTAMETRTWLSPGVEWSRERFSGLQPEKREETFLITQGIDLSGRIWARREAASQRAKAGQAESILREAELAAQVRGAFHELRVARERTLRVERALQRLDRVQQQVERLHKAGEMSGLDRGRVRRELELLRGRQAQEAALRRQAEARLAALLGESAGPLDGEILPPEPEPLESLLAQQQSAPNTTMSRAQEAAALAEAKAARRWLPEFTLGLGVKRWQENGFSGRGSVVSLGFTLPTFGKARGSRLRGEAEAHAAGAQARLQRQQAEGELRVRWQDAVELRHSAETLIQESLADPAKVETAMDAAFAAGEMDLLERLDGSRNLLEAELAALDQALRAHQARITLDRMLGKVNP